MNNQVNKVILPKILMISIVISAVTIFSLSCAAVGPVLKNAAVAFGQDLFASALENHNEKYASQLEELLLALVQEKTGVELEPRLNQQNDENYDEGQDEQEEYSDEYSQDQYEQVENSETYSDAQYSQEEDYSEDFNQQQRPSQDKGLEPVSMDIALLAQRRLTNGSITMEAIQDGATLYDGMGDPQSGDKIKVSFKTNCNCYVYIIGIDATGWVAQIFPDTDSPFGNPVQESREYLLPEGNVWWGLDDYKGIETIYFIASYQQRTDIEYILDSLVKNKRESRTTYRPVTTAAIVPRTRGLVKVKDAAPMNVQSQSGQLARVTPTSFLSTNNNYDLIITRWFNHR